MENLNASAASDLLRQLRDVDIAVPSRRERTSAHCERWSICRFLATFSNSPILNYPLMLEKGERPDFVLTQLGTQVGIEVTEAIMTDQAWVAAHREKLKLNSPRLFHRFMPNEPQRDKHEIDAIARGERPAEGWAGDAVEKEWAEAILSVCSKKAESFANKGIDVSTIIGCLSTTI